MNIRSMFFLTVVGPKMSLDYIYLDEIRKDCKLSPGTLLALLLGREAQTSMFTFLLTLPFSVLAIRENAFVFYALSSQKDPIFQMLT